ncbi:MAG TPA: hypothetical protein PLN69_09570 [bacterium]|nr:hypothetical protein [bacterium]
MIGFEEGAWNEGAIDAYYNIPGLNTTLSLKGIWDSLSSGRLKLKNSVIVAGGIELTAFMPVPPPPPDYSTSYSEE